MSTIDMKIEKISPSKAATLLKGNTSNRSIRPGVVKKYARDMKSGNWLESGDPIRLNGDGTLLDGQHRLSAIIESGVTQKVVVIRGLKKESMLAMDTGAKRSFADVLRLEGYKNVTAIAASVRWCVCFEDDRRDPKSAGVTHSEMMAWLVANPGIDAATVAAIASTNPILVRARTPMAALRYYAAKQHDWDLFSARLASGTGLEEGDPIHTLRRFIENSAIATRRPDARVIHAVTVKAWNAYMEGAKIASLRFTVGGAKPEEFPTIVTGH